MNVSVPVFANVLAIYCCVLPQAQSWSLDMAETARQELVEARLQYYKQAATQAETQRASSVQAALARLRQEGEYVSEGHYTRSRNL